jgi:hypothetical protein
MLRTLVTLTHVVEFQRWGDFAKSINPGHFFFGIPALVKLGTMCTACSRLKRVVHWNTLLFSRIIFMLKWCMYHYALTEMKFGM